ncbi:retrotransposable element Tf2 [Tanacetum coccineum]
METVDRSLQVREAAIEMIKFHIARAQNRMKKCGDLKRMEPEVILDRRIGKLNYKEAAYVLVKWVNHPKENATWELYEDLVQRFLDFSLYP